MRIQVDAWGKQRPASGAAKRGARESTGIRIMPRMPASRLVRVIIIIVSVAILASIAGCASNRTPPHFRDIPRDKAGWTEGRRLWSDGRTLHVAIDEDPRGLYVSRIEYEVFDGNLYLATVRQSRPFAPAKFEIDTRGLTLHEPWQDHVYWVADVKWDSVTRRAATVGSTLGQHVDRVKAEVDPRPGESSALRTDRF